MKHSLLVANKLTLPAYSAKFSSLLNTLHVFLFYADDIHDFNLLILIMNVKQKYINYIEFQLHTISGQEGGLRLDESSAK